MSYATLGAKVKAKHPEYADLADDVVGQKVATKYPGQYDDIVGAAPAPTRTVATYTPPKKQGFLKNVDDFTQAGVDNFYGGLVRGGAGLVKLVTPDSVDKKVDTVTNRSFPAAKSDTPAQAYGGALGNILKGTTETFATLPIGGPEGMGLKAVLTRAGINGAQGFVQGAASSGEKGNSSGTQLKDALVSGAVSAAIPASIESASAGFKTVLGKGAQAAYDSIVGTPLKQVLAGKEEIGSGLLERNIKGGLNTMVSKVQSILDTNGPKVAAAIEKAKGTTVSLDEALRTVQELAQQASRTPGEASVASSLQKMADDLAVIHKSHNGQVPVEIAQQLKQDLQAAVNRGFLNPNTQGVTDAQKKVAQELRRQIEAAVPEVVPHNKEVEFALRAREALMKKAAQSPGFFDKLRGIGEGVSGIMNPAAIPAIVAGRVATSTPVQSHAASAAYNISKKTVNPRLYNLLTKLGITLGTR